MGKGPAASRIEDYAVIGDCETAALVARNGSIDWLCLPRFDSGACFAALLGTPEHGRWQIAPAVPWQRVTRRYRDDTLVLETDFELAGGECVRVIDWMPPRNQVSDLVRIVRGIRGRVPMHLDLRLRFDYGSVVPWVRHINRGIRAVAGPDSVCVRGDIPLRGEDLHTVADFTIDEGQSRNLTLTWAPITRETPALLDAEQCLAETEAWWCAWTSRCRCEHEWTSAVKRSLITLKALTYAPTGGLVAAATTSLPERIGGQRNWDYRHCWLRDATFTLYSFLGHGYVDEAIAWREWLVNAVAGKPEHAHIMYGLAGERRLTEMELEWLPGYEGSRPVRVGNQAYRQHQLDVTGAVMDALHLASRMGIEANDNAWRVQQALLSFLERDWRHPDEGIWEVRGPRRQFVHSKVMAWVAADRAVRAVEHFGASGPVERWRALRADIHEEVCQRGFDPELGSFVQYYGSKSPDASLLVIPLVGFLPASDPRVRGTVDFIERKLFHGGLVYRYPTDAGVDGLPPGEGAFLLCSFWFIDNLVIQGRHAEARRLFESLLALRNDVGLLAEQYDPSAGRMLGNFPQAFSHVGLINSARYLSRPVTPY